MIPGEISLLPIVFVFCAILAMHGCDQSYGGFKEWSKRWFTFACVQEQII